MEYPSTGLLCVCVCVLHFLEFIYEASGEWFDLVNITFRRCLSEGDTLRCIQHEEKVNRTICSQNKQTNKRWSSAHHHPLNSHNTAKWRIRGGIYVIMNQYNPKCINDHSSTHQFKWCQHWHHCCSSVGQHHATFYPSCCRPAPMTWLYTPVLYLLHSTLAVEQAWGASPALVLVQFYLVEIHSTGRSSLRHT